MPKHTDSAIVEYNEDGSRTITTVETIYPISRKKQIASAGSLGLVAVAPAVPLLALFVLAKVAEKNADRKKNPKVKKTN